MEALYAKLHDKYTNLKKQKASEIEKLNCDQEEKFINYVSAADELIEHLNNEKNMLSAQVNDLRREVASLRSTKDEEHDKYEKLLMEENRKNEELSEEIERLHRKEFHSSSGNDIFVIEQGSPMSSDRTSNSKMRKRRRDFRHEKDADVALCLSSQQEHGPVGESENTLPKETMSDRASYDINQPKCCRQKLGNSGNVYDSTSCMFQELVECLVNLKFSTVTQTDEVFVAAVHESSGYSFSLRWVKKSGGEEELLYEVSSLGTFERVAPQWMREVMLFSKTMCPIFFKRLSYILNIRH